ncbi:hypothetical protein BH23PLA1_BH23PLA1_10620 [soil metagenome]
MQPLMPLIFSILAALPIGSSPLTAEEPADAPRLVAAWPDGPLSARLAFDRPVDPDLPDRLTGLEIPFRAGGEGNEPLGKLRVAGARLEDDGRTIVLLTDPHAAEATYALSIAGVPITYDLTGVQVSWTGAEEESWSGWLPELDMARARERTLGSADQDRAFALFSRKGELELSTLLDLPEGETTIELEASVPFAAELAFEPAESSEDPQGLYRASFTIDTFGEAVDLFLTLPTGEAAPLSLRISTRTADEPDPLPLPGNLQVLPWAPPPSAAAEAPTEVPETLLGGDPGRGEAVYFGDQGKCSACHQVNGRGETIGPDLSAIATKYDAAEIYREIESPSAVIHPDYLPYTVAAVDGRVAVGIVRAEGPDAIRIADVDARVTTMLRSEVEEIQPSATSIMPVGLTGAIGEDGMRDLLAYLLHLRGD